MQPLRKAIAMGVWKPINNEQNFALLWPDFINTFTPWVRIWVDWVQLAPFGPNNPPTDYSRPLDYGTTAGNLHAQAYGNFSPAEYTAGIDVQLKIARDHGIFPMLTFYRFPSWASGKSNPLDPTSLDTTYNSHWAQYLTFCMCRWSQLNPYNNGAYAEILEICNEPNLCPSNSSFSLAGAVLRTGRMMVSAQQRQRYEAYPGYPVLAGPATHGQPGNSSKRIDALQFTSDVVGYLQPQNNSGFDLNDPYFAWTVHNYTDIANQVTTNSQGMRDRLLGKWNGWPGAGYSQRPWVLQTEGGMKLTGTTEADQANKMTIAFNQAKTNTISATIYGGEYHTLGGQGLAMISQYLDISAPTFDTGMRHYNAPYYSDRTLWTYWRALG